MAHKITRKSFLKIMTADVAGMYDDTTNWLA